MLGTVESRQNRYLNKIRYLVIISDDRSKHLTRTVKILAKGSSQSQTVRSNSTTE